MNVILKRIKKACKDFQKTFEDRRFIPQRNEQIISLLLLSTP